uniref:Uncharacterized protein n=1 Tax=Anguilla anguilla TaxID=7936 RepID=A0A0E9WJ13_ANGAN
MFKMTAATVLCSYKAPLPSSFKCSCQNNIHIKPNSHLNDWN